MPQVMRLSKCSCEKAPTFQSKATQDRSVSRGIFTTTQRAFELTCQQNALHFASSKSNTSTVRTLIANKCSARVKDKRGQLPLHRAAAVGSVPILKILLEEGKSPVNATDGDGFTALHHAISEGHGDAAILLLKSGAEPEKRDSDGRLAIELVPDEKVRTPSA
jgi:ankyrin repeat protein